MRNILSIISQWLAEIIFSLLVAAVPLFFLPWTSPFLELAKQYYFWLAVPSGLFFWFLSGVFRGKISFVRTILDWPIIIFLGVSALSLFFSISRPNSFFGRYGAFGDSLLTWFCLAGVFFLAGSVFSGRPEKYKLMVRLFLISTSLVLAVSLLAMIKYSNLYLAGKLGFFEFDRYLEIGSLENLALIGAITSVFYSGLILFAPAKGRRQKLNFFLLSIFILISLAGSALLDFSLAWIIFLAGALLEVNLYFFKVKRGQGGSILWPRLFWPTIFIILSVFFLVMPADAKAGLPFFIASRQLPREARLDWNSSAAIASASLLDNFAWGRGQGNYSNIFSAYRPASLNLSADWQVRFNHARTYAMEVLSTSGLVGFISFVFIFLLFFYLLALIAAKGRDYDYILAVSWFLLLFLPFSYGFNGGLFIIIWLASGAICGWKAQTAASQPAGIFRMADVYPGGKRSLIMIAAGTSALGAWLYFADVYIIRPARADYYFQQGGEQKMLAAIALQPRQWYYKSKLAEYYLSQAVGEYSRGESRNIFEEKARKSVELAAEAAAIAPQSVVANETLAMVYRDLGRYSPEADGLAAECFAGSLELEPSNPVLAAEAGKAYFAAGNNGEAEKYFLLSRNLKPDYHSAEFGLAKIYARQDQAEKAWPILRSLESSNPSDPEIYYEEGRLEYNAKNYAAAIERFSLAIKIMPDHSNSLYGLGLIYEALGENKVALSYLERVLELNPENGEVGDKVEKLKL